MHEGIIDKLANRVEGYDVLIHAFRPRIITYANTLMISWSELKISWRPERFSLMNKTNSWLFSFQQFGQTP